MTVLVEPGGTGSLVLSPALFSGTHLSYSQLRTYGLCPLQWHFSRQFEPEQVGSGLVFGGAFHRAVEAFYRALQEGRKIGKEEMLSVFRAAWKEETDGVAVHYGKSETEKSLLETADRMLDAYLKAIRPGKIIAVEKNLRMKWDEALPPVVGTIDLIEIQKDEKGRERLHLVDHKTAARKPSEKEDLDPDQLLLYARLARKSGFLDEYPLPVVLRLDLVTKTKSPEFVRFEYPLETLSETRLLEKSRRIWKGMSEEIVYPLESWACASCGFKSRCDKWPLT